MTTDAIVLEDLDKFFPPALSGWRAFVQPFVRPTQRALQRISLQVSAGEAMALVGANGAGKSTLLRILATLLLPTRGCARVAGFDVVREGARVRSQLGFQIGSDADFYARLTARENLRFFAALNHIAGGEAAKRIDSVADLLGLGDALERPGAHTLNRDGAPAGARAGHPASSGGPSSRRTDAKPRSDGRGAIPPVSR